MEFGDRRDRFRFLIRDGIAKSAAFNAVFVVRSGLFSSALPTTLP